MEKSGWMIEKQINGVPHWWIRKPGQYEFWDLPHRWTTDPNAARLYDTRADAEFVIGKDMVGCVATDHSWIKTEAAPQENAETASTDKQQSKPEITLLTCGKCCGEFLLPDTMIHHRCVLVNCDGILHDLEA
jgi:hypothetical protein